VEGTQSEADGEVVDAQGCAGDQQPPGRLARRCGWYLTVMAGRAAEGLDDGVAAGGDQQRCADPMGGLAEGGGKAAAQQQAQDGHAGLEEAEDHPNAPPGLRVNTAHPDANRGGEVRQPQGDGHKH